MKRDLCRVFGKLLYLQSGEREILFLIVGRLGILIYTYAEKTTIQTRIICSGLCERDYKLGDKNELIMYVQKDVKLNSSTVLSHLPLSVSFFV